MFRPFLWTSLHNDIGIERGDRIDKNQTGEGVKIRPLENIVENRKGKEGLHKKKEKHLQPCVY